MLISEAMQEKLNQQIQHEFYAEHTYLAIAASFDAAGLKVFGRVFWDQAAEEHGHAMRIIGYLGRVGGNIELRGVPEPRTAYATVLERIEAAMAAEVETTRKVHAIAALAEEEHDFSTRSFIQWKVDEQVEELEKMTDLLNLVKMGGDGQWLLVEARLSEMMAEWAAAEAADES